MHRRGCWLQPEQEGCSLSLWSSICRESSLTNYDPMSNHEFLSLRPEVRHRPAACGDGDSWEGNENNPAKRRRGDLGKLSRSSGRMTPWRNKSKPYSSGVVGLHEEILEFYQFMSPLTDEKEMRRDLVARVTSVICEQWPHAKVEIFGSFRTGLFLPTSDIDLVVFGGWEQLPLHTLGDLLVTAGISRREDIKVIESARVPIVKLTDQQTGIKVDISFNMTTGVASAQMTKDYMKMFAAMPKLVLVLKQFLIQRDLNEVFTGGISSYSLILLVVSFLQMQCRKKPEGIDQNLGVLLMEFFELYGRHFNYENTAIRIAGDGSYFSKDILTDDHPLSNPSFLTIEDPLDHTNDISRASWGAKQVKTAFEHAYSVLASCVLEKSPEAEDVSYLGRILQVREDVIDFRRKSVQQWRTYAASSAATQSPPGSYSFAVTSSTPHHKGDKPGHVRRHSSPISTTSEAQPTGSQLTYAAAAGAGRAENASATGMRSSRSNSVSSNANHTGDTELRAKLMSSSGSSSSVNSAGSAPLFGGIHSGDIQAGGVCDCAAVTSPSTAESSDEQMGTSVMSDHHIHAYHDNSKGSVGKYHTPLEAQDSTSS